MADLLLAMRVRIPPEARMSVSCERCVLSGRCLGVGPITRPGGVLPIVCHWCDLETSEMRWPWSELGCCTNEEKEKEEEEQQLALLVT